MSLDLITAEQPSAEPIESSTPRRRHRLLVTALVLGALGTATLFPWLPAQQEARDAAQSLLLQDGAVMTFADVEELQRDATRPAAVAARNATIARLWAPEVAAKQQDDVQKAVENLASESDPWFTRAFNIALFQYGSVLIWGDTATLNVQATVSYERFGSVFASKASPWFTRDWRYEIKLKRNDAGHWQLLSVTRDWVGGMG